MKKYKKLSKNEINSLSQIQFDGDVEVLSSNDNVQAAVNYLMNYDLIGFDTETKPTFVKGPLNPPSIMQLACIDKVYIFQLDNESLYKKLFPILSNENITKCGVSVDRDLIELMYLSPFDPLSFVDLGNIARDNDVPHHGLRGLVAMFLKHRISKGAQISDWSKTVLSQSQITYAATDAWISLKLFEAFEQNDLL
ncbi:MAG: 3'-5' exonuclease [Candidatus Neomarinimicrobiota bacterium]